MITFSWKYIKITISDDNVIVRKEKGSKVEDVSYFVSSYSIHLKPTYFRTLDIGLRRMKKYRREICVRRTILLPERTRLYPLERT